MYFVRPELFWMLIPLAIVLYILLRKEFIRIDHDLRANKEFMQRRRRIRLFLFFTRFVIFGLIIVMFAQPYLESQSMERGDPQMTILVDNSSSMELFDMSFVDELTEHISTYIPTTVRYITPNPLESPLGNALVSNLEQDTNILLISDLQSTTGISIDDAVMYASLLNATISAINLDTEVQDAAVWIQMEDKATKDQEVIITVNVRKLNMDEYNIMVSVDDVPIYNARHTQNTIHIPHTFDVGEHVITAKILNEDHIAENNVFHKTLTVVPQPKVLYVTRSGSQLPQLLRQHYDVTTTQSIPADLAPYYTVIIEDMPAQDIGHIEELAAYVSEGNGLFVIGGMNSFDRGGYKQASFETLLPVHVGRGEKKQGDSNIVILIDMSGSVQDYYQIDSQGNLIKVSHDNPIDVMKALAIDVIETLNRGNRVGAVAFALPDVDDRGRFKAVKIADIEPLSMNMEQMVDRISRIDSAGQTLFDVGLSGAYAMLRRETGSRNVIMISDGDKFVYPPVKENAIKIAQQMANEGMRVYTVGVGRDEASVDEEFMKNLAHAGNGLYFPAGREDRLKILFGTPEEKQQGDQLSLFVLNPYHFITQDIEPSATMYGFNQIVPKNLARTIITTDSGEPALTEWRYGLGKVVALTVFSGTAGLGQLLQDENSRILTRTINYLIGDPERKEPYIVTIPDSYVNDMIRVHVHSEHYPSTSQLEFSRVRDNEYEGLIRAQETGIHTVLDRKYAVNYPREFKRLGMRDDAEELLSITEGRLFESSEVQEIIEHARTHSVRTRIDKDYITWHIIALIILIYLLEIIVRKMAESRRKV